MCKAAEIERNFYTRAAAFACAVLLCIGLWPAARAADAASGEGIVRVLLSEAGKTGALRVGIYGSYLMDDHLTFQRGTWLNVYVRGDALWLSYEGMAYRAGKRVVFVRHPVDSGENGLRLDNGLNLLAGDLVLSLDGQKIRAVLHIGMEEYLLGVVPYEMNDGFPLEALKAQAVAARTYAARNRDTASDHDVVDNTNDQVYRGLDAQHKNAHRAVQETAGVYAYSGDRYAQCYYTASNGGQTESAFNAWGRERVSYLPITDDPYDLENPDSEVRRAMLPKVVTDGVVFSSEFTDAIKAALVPHLEKQGINPALESFRIDQVVGAQVHTARHGGESRLMTRVQLELMLSAQRARQTDNDEEVSISGAVPTQQPGQSPWLPMAPLSASMKVDLDYFETVEALLHLSINRNANELVSIRETDDAFVLEARRYGHGVGLSQRGAEWMAKTYSWTYEQILRFYYPGISLRTRDIKQHTRAQLQADFLSTPGPIPTATPRPTLMPLTQTPAPEQWVVAVHGVSRNSTLNLREQPNLSGKVLVQLYYGQKLLVLESLPDGWLHVRTDVLEGYVMEQYVERVLSSE